MRERLAVIVIALGLFMATGCAAQPPFERVKPATFQLGVPGGSCSGTAVGYSTILTASHCFHDGAGNVVKPAHVTVTG